MISAACIIFVFIYDNNISMTVWWQQKQEKLEQEISRLKLSVAKAHENVSIFHYDTSVSTWLASVLWWISFYLCVCVCLLLTVYVMWTPIYKILSPERFPVPKITFKGCSRSSAMSSFNGPHVAFYDLLSISLECAVSMIQATPANWISSKIVGVRKLLKLSTWAVILIHQLIA